MENNITRERAAEQLKSVIDDLNLGGLKMLLFLYEGMNEIEIYNINTTPERVKEIRAEEEAKEKEKEESRNEELLTRPAKRRREREEKIAALTGKDKIFWNKIKKVENIKGLDRYGMNFQQSWFIQELYKGDLLEGSYIFFKYGLHQGMQYMKNETKRAKATNKQKVSA